MAKSLILFLNCFFQSELESILLTCLKAYIRSAFKETWKIKMQCFCKKKIILSEYHKSQLKTFCSA